MIQKFNLNINTIFKNKSVNYLNPPSADEFKDFESYISVHLETSDHHYHNDELCKSPNLKKVLSYSRNYITFTGHQVNEETVDIPVFYCSNDHIIIFLSYFTSLKDNIEDVSKSNNV